jgi:hypothetical protein
MRPSGEAIATLRLFRLSAMPEICPLTAIRRRSLPVRAFQARTSPQVAPATTVEPSSLKRADCHWPRQ